MLCELAFSVLISEVAAFKTVPERYVQRRHPRPPRLQSECSLSSASMHPMSRLDGNQETTNGGDLDRRIAGEFALLLRIVHRHLLDARK